MSTDRKAPAYLRISGEISAEIARGVFHENEKLPTEGELCARFGVSRITVRHALALLEQQGTIRKRRGQGIFVCPQTYEQPIGGLYSFAQTCIGAGLRHRYKVLSMEQRQASAEIALKLGLFAQSACCVVTMLCTIDDEPYAHGVSYIPVQMFAGATPEGIERDGIYEQIHKCCGLMRDTATERLQAVLAPTDVLGAFKRSGSLAMLKIERLSTADARPIEYFVCHLLGDKITLTTTLQ